MPNLIPAINLALDQIEVISGIPRIITTGTPDSSAVRTDGSYRTAYRSASKKIAGLVKRGKDRVLRPAIDAFYLHELDSGLLKDTPVDTMPELLMDERLSGDIQSENAGQMLNDIGPFIDRVPEATVNGIINQHFRSTYGVDYDIVPGVNPIGNVTPAQNTGEL